MLDELTNLSNPVAVVVDVLILLIVANWLWNNAFKPAWLAVSGFVEQRQRQAKLNTFADGLDDDLVTQQEQWEILRDIADKFKPNGQTLWERLDEIEQGSEARADKIAGEVAELRNLFDTFLVERRNGGRRKFDPHEEHP